MKIGTLSVNINTPDYNYGALLHSYAFIEYLKKLDFVEHAEVIDYITPYVLTKKREWVVPKEYARNNFRDYFTLKRMKHSFKVRDKKFKKFIKKNMTVSKKQYLQDSLKSEKFDYDTLVCESDVIWSPLLTGGKLDPAFFLSFNNMKSIKKIAYSPSIGDNIYDKQQEKDLKKYLKSLDFISCRESYAKDILEKYTDKKITHVLDPVMLLDESNFNKITGPKLSKEKYILLYLPVNDNKKLRKQAKEFAQKYNYKIIEISTKLIKRKSKMHITLPDAGIEEFLSGIKYADYVFTNSLHAVCFSIIFKKQFYAFSRKYAGKVKDVCEIFGLSKRFFPTDEFVEQKDIDYDKVYKKYYKLKEKSEKYILNALMSKKN